MPPLKEKLKEQLVLSRDVRAIRTIDKLLDYAIGLEAGEICFESEDKGLAVIFRADNEVKNRIMIPKKIEQALLAGFRELSGARSSAAGDVSWNGRFKKDYPGLKIIFSLSARSTASGEKMTIGLQKEKFELLEVGRLGFSARNLAAVKKNLNERKGLTLVAGEFNSGRTTTLYSFLNHINHPELNVATIEKEVAYDIPKINQSRLDPISGYDSSSAISSLRRQNVDAVMIGDINDKETAEAALHLALGGHFVLGGFYGSDVASILSFFQDLSIPLHLFAAAVKMVVAQRLVRKNCPHCLAKQKIGENARKKLKENFAFSPLLKRMRADKLVSEKVSKPEDLVFYKSRGCSRCRGSGLAGRVGIFEVLRMTPEAKQTVKEGHFSGIRQEISRQGGYLLKEEALLKAISGLTTIEEVFKIIDNR
jgi:type II secretory ATPase GspE/PulE/Tfp pilus assembly ATPase PilB-like protein